MVPRLTGNEEYARLGPQCLPPLVLRPEHPTNRFRDHRRVSAAETTGAAMHSHLDLPALTVIQRQAAVSLTYPLQRRAWAQSRGRAWNAATGTTFGGSTGACRLRCRLVRLGVNRLVVRVDV